MSDTPIGMTNDGREIHHKPIEEKRKKTMEYRPKYISEAFGVGVLIGIVIGIVIGIILCLLSL